MDTVARVMVTDLRHFLDLPTDIPGTARRLADQLGDIVRAATSGDAGTPWESALHCRRRPRNRTCPGRIIVVRNEFEGPIQWRCSVCDDNGTITNWEGSPFDLRRRRLALAEPATDIVIADEIAATLRDLQLLDPDCERLVFRIRANRGDAAILSATDKNLQKLVDAVAAQTNYEPTARRQKRLDAARAALSDIRAEDF